MNKKYQLLNLDQKYPTWTGCYGKDEVETGLTTGFHGQIEIGADEDDIQAPQTGAYKNPAVK